MSGPPVISMILPTYNGARFIRETVDSCLSQSFSDFELIVVVDGSTDETEQILESYRDRRMTVVKTANQGQAEAMNTGFALAKGKYYSWTSDDNVYMPDAFRVMAAYLDSRPDASAVAADCLTIDEHGKLKAYKSFMWQCFLYRAEAAQKVGPHRPEARVIEDMDFAVRLEHAVGAIHRIHRPYLKYRIHSGMISSSQRLDRQLISVRVNYDHIVNGVSKEDLKAMFLDRLSRSALYRDHASMDAILAFAEEKGVPFTAELQARVRYLKSRSGWLSNRLRIAFRSKLGAVRDRLRLYAYLIRSKIERSP